MYPLMNDATFDVVIDKAKFTFRYPTAAEYVRHADVSSDESIKRLGTFQKVYDSLIEAVSTCLIGWDGIADRAGQPVPFDKSRLGDVLTYDGLWQVYFLWRSNSRLDTDTKKG